MVIMDPNYFRSYVISDLLPLVRSPKTNRSLVTVKTKSSSKNLFAGVYFAARPGFGAHKWHLAQPDGVAWVHLLVGPPPTGNNIRGQCIAE